MSCNLAVIGVGNMAKAIICGIQRSTTSISRIFLYDKSISQYDGLCAGRCEYVFCDTPEDAVAQSDCVLIAVKPQNYPEVLSKISAVDHASDKLYITIGAGISQKSVAEAVGSASVVRVLPNLPMTIGCGVSVICKNPDVRKEDFELVRSVFECSGSVLTIDESDMNAIIGVTSSSPAYVFRFIDCIYEGALSQGIECENLLEAICDVFIGSAKLLKASELTPKELISQVASKGGTTERALDTLEKNHVDEMIRAAMVACTDRADELGAQK